MKKKAVFAAAVAVVCLGIAVPAAARYTEARQTAPVQQTVQEPTETNETQCIVHENCDGTHENCRTQQVCAENSCTVHENCDGTHKNCKTQQVCTENSCTVHENCDGTHKDCNPQQVCTENNCSVHENCDSTQNGCDPQQVCAENNCDVHQNCSGSHERTDAPCRDTHERPRHHGGHEGHGGCGN